MFIAELSRYPNYDICVPNQQRRLAACPSGRDWLRSSWFSMITTSVLSCRSVGQYIQRIAAYRCFSILQFQVHAQRLAQLTDVLSQPRREVLRLVGPGFAQVNPLDSCQVRCCHLIQYFGRGCCPLPICVPDLAIPAGTWTGNAARGAGPCAGRGWCRRLRPRRCRRGSLRRCRGGR